MGCSKNTLNGSCFLILAKEKKILFQLAGLFSNGPAGVTVDFRLKYSMCVCLWRIRGKTKGIGLSNIKLKQHTMMHIDGLQEEAGSTYVNIIYFAFL